MNSERSTVEKLGLCRTCHDVPVVGYIYGTQWDAMGYDELYTHARKVIAKRKSANEDIHIALYNTRASDALDAMIQACIDTHTGLTIMRHNEGSKCYFAQAIVW